jgi:DNA polymerase
MTKDNQKSLLATSEKKDSSPSNQLPATSFQSLEKAKEVAMECTKCKLSESRTHVVFSKGSPEAKVMLIGEGPGQNEDLQGIPFVGKAGQLLDKIFESVNIDPEKDVYICNIVKCRPPQNRKPQQDEMDACWDYLAAQIKYIQPKIIILSGASAVQGVLKIKEGITKIRGNWYNGVFGAKAIPIFHPAYLLRNQSKEKGSPKWLMWQDIQEIKNAMDSLE